MPSASSISSWASGYITWSSCMGSPSSWAAARFASSAARSPPAARAFSVALATTAFSSASMRTRGDAPALGLDARPLVERGAVHGRVVGQLGRLHDAAPRPLLRVEAGVYRRALRGVSAAFGGGQAP